MIKEGVWRDPFGPHRKKTNSADYLYFVVMEILDSIEKLDPELAHQFQDEYAVQLFCSEEEGLGI